MLLPSPFVRLPLTVDAAALAAEIAAVPEQEWKAHPQGFAGNSALPLVAAGGDPDDNATRGPMRPTPVLSRLPYVQQVMAALGAPLGRSRLMRLEAEAEATLHVDVNYYWQQRVRVHVPVVTSPTVRFQCADQERHMAAGEVWIFDTFKLHNVLNPHDAPRIHLVVDTVGSAAFWDLVGAGDDGTGTAEPAPLLVPGPPAPLVFESVNHPVVMTPWELRELVTQIGSQVDAGPDAVARLDVVLDRLCQDWTALWAVHGSETPEPYAALVARTRPQLTALQGTVPLRNQQDLAGVLDLAVLGAAVNPELARTPAATPPAAARTPRSATRRTAPARSGIDRPVFIVSAPRSGSTLLFETLAQSPDLWTIGSESHGLIEGLPQLHPSAHGWASNRLTAQHADPATVDALARRFREELRDRDGEEPRFRDEPVRMLEKTPKNSLRVPFLAQAFPDARFVYLYRDPMDTLSSMLEAWRSGHFVTYPDLPGWQGTPWSLLLVPGWQDLVGEQLATVVAHQWRRCTEVLLDDLDALGPDRWAVASYGRLVAEPQQEVERLCSALDLRWDRTLEAPLPPSRTTLTKPEPGKWRDNAELLEPLLPLVADVSERARELYGREPGPSRAAAVVDAPPLPAMARSAEPPAEAAAPASSSSSPDADFGSSSTPSFAELLGALGSSLLVSTYQSGRLIAFREDEGRLNTHFREFDSPMGLAVDGPRLAIGTRRQVWEYRDQPAVAAKVEPVGKHDGCFLPRSTHFTGDVRVHELAFAEGELWFISTLFSCLATLDAEHSFVPRWRPPFVSALAPEDRCHLNGFTAVDGRIRYATALGVTDTAGGWRADKAAGGVLLEVPSGEVVARGLSMPHSPRWHDGKLWVLQSGKGELGTVDVATGEVTTVARMPGFTRGLSFAGPYAFVGLSQVRETVFSGLPIVDHPDLCSGVWVIDTRTGSTAAFLRFDGAVQEIFDVALLPGYRFPEIGEPGSELTGSSFVLPTDALADVPREVLAGT